MGAKECELCPEGKYSAQAGSVVCFDCIPGTFSNTTGIYHRVLCLCFGSSVISYNNNFSINKNFWNGVCALTVMFWEDRLGSIRGL